MDKMATGTLCWFDIATRDEEKAKAFYNKVLGWEFSPMGPDYWLVKAGSDGIGGLRREKTFTSGDGVMTYFAVPSVKEGRALVTNAGGKLVGENVAINAGENGHFQIFTDLDGNMLALWSKKP